jgi:hypothetical protein
MFAFNDMGLLAVVAPLAFADRKRIVEKATMGLIAIAFMAYYVSVGVDEMQWHRLYLPALPFLCVLAALGAQNAVEAIARVVAARAGVSRRAFTRSRSPRDGRPSCSPPIRTWPSRCAR